MVSSDNHDMGSDIPSDFFFVSQKRPILYKKSREKKKGVKHQHKKEERKRERKS